MSGTIAVSSRLRPELVGRVGVARMQPRLLQLPVLDMEDLDGVVVESLALPLSSRPQERHGMLVVGQDRVDVELEGSAGQFHVFLEVGEDLILAPEGPGELVASRGVPDDVVGEQLIQSGHVAGGERLVAPADKILVGVSQWFLLVSADRPKTMHPPVRPPVRQMELGLCEATRDLRRTTASATPSESRSRRATAAPDGDPTARARAGP